jgi:hypothetical protein
VVGLGAALPTWASVLNVKGHIPKPLDPFQFTALVRKWLQ